MGFKVALVLCSLGFVAVLAGDPTPQKIASENVKHVEESDHSAGGPHPAEGPTAAPEHPVEWTWPWPRPKTTTSTTTTTTTTTPPSTTSTTPTPPPTPTTTTTTPTPPTPTPPTPTPPTTTTTPPPTTTTPQPTPTTTTTPPLTTTTPKPTPKVDRGNWTVTDDNKTCIYFQAVLSAKIQYPLNNSEVQHVMVSIPSNASASGKCDNQTDSVNLKWGNHSADFVFSKVPNSRQYDLANITLTLAVDNNTFPNISTGIDQLVYKSEALLFVTSLGYSYRCSVEKSVPLVNGTASNGTVLGTLSFNKLQLEAFSESSVAKFGAPEDCDEDASDMVPIVVGCALAALVVIILGVYVWGRRRSQNRGYLSM